MMNASKKRREIRLKRKISIRKKVAGTAERPRVCLTRSHRNITAQVVDDERGATLVACDGRRIDAVAAPEGVTGKCARLTPWVARWPTRPRRRASAAWCSTAAATSTTGAWPPWPAGSGTAASRSRPVRPEGR
jgi:hypothetical protein